VVNQNLILLFDFMPRVGQVLDEVTVICEQQQTFRIFVEPANIAKGVKSRRQEIIDRWPLPLIIPGRDQPTRFVQCKNLCFELNSKDLTRGLHDILFTNLRRKVGNSVPINRDAARSD